MKSSILLTLSQVYCFVSASEAFLPSSSSTTSTSTLTNRIGAGGHGDVFRGDATSLFMKNKKQQNQPTSSSSPHNRYHDVDVRLYQSSTAASPPSSSTFLSTPSSLGTSSTPDTTSSHGQSPSSLIQNGVTAVTRSSPLIRAVASATIFVVMNTGLQQLFLTKAIAFPSSLAGCMALAIGLLSSPNHRQIYKVLAPGSKLLQKFLMVFLVPNLIVLPLCDGCGSVTEVSCCFCCGGGGCV